MKFNNLIVDGVSIINSILNKKIEFKEGKADPLVESFVEWVIDCKEEHEPKNAIVFLPSEGDLSLERIHAITKILKDIGIYSSSINDLSVGNSISSFLAKVNGESLVSSDSILMAQFISDSVKFKKFENDEVINENRFNDITGINKNDIPRLISMIGDSSLSLKTYIGPNTAVSWINDYGSFENIEKNVSKMTRSMREIFIKNKGNIKMQLKDTDFSIPSLNVEKIEMYNSIVKEENTDSLYKNFIDYKLYKLLPKEIREQYIPKTNLGSENTYSTKIKNNKEAKSAILIGVEEGTASIVLGKNNDCSITFKKGESYYLDLNEDIGKKFLSYVLQKDTIKIVSHNAKDLYKWSFKNKITMNGLVSDAAILSYCISTKNSEKSLDALFDEVIGEKVEFGLSDNKDDDLVRVLCEKSNNQLQLNRALYSIASKDKNARIIFEEIELPLIKVLSKMESKGVFVNIDEVKKIGEEIDSESQEITKKIDLISNEKYDISKANDVAKLLYDDLNLPVNKKTASGARSVSEENLLSISHLSDIPKEIINYSSMNKIKSSYVIPLTNKVSKETGRVHCRFMQNVTSTGRLSARDPNLQSIPIKSEKGKRIRQAFQDDKDYYIVAADYSQVELRILAHLSGDKNLISAFNSGEDIHKKTASEIFEIPLNEVTGEQRRCTKSINFGIIYGMSSYGLSKKINRTEKECSDFIKKYFEKYPGVQKFLEDTKRFAKENGYILTGMGRKIHIDNINSEKYSEVKGAERVAVNAPMQGTSSDIIKTAMNNINEIEGINFDMLMQVHDELVFRCHKSQVKEFHDIIKEVMENSFKMDVPLIVDIGIGKNWENSHSLDENASIEIDSNELTM